MSQEIKKNLIKNKSEKNKSKKVQASLKNQSPQLKIQEILKKVTPSPWKDNFLSDDDKIKKISYHYQEILKTLGLDLNHESINQTPLRMAKMYVQELFKGLSPQAFPKMTLIENEMQYDQMIVVSKIKVMSVCEHHLQPIHGQATVAYIPNKKVIGLSKINRLVHYFSRRPQVQERLTKQIADSLQIILDTEHVAVIIEAKHYCVIARGVEDQDSLTKTSDLRGHFKTMPQTRAEFLSQIQK